MSSSAPFRGYRSVSPITAVELRPAVTVTVLDPDVGAAAPRCGSGSAWVSLPAPTRIWVAARPTTVARDHYSRFHRDLVAPDQHPRSEAAAATSTASLTRVTSGSAPPRECRPRRCLDVMTSPIVRSATCMIARERRPIASSRAAHQRECQQAERPAPGKENHPREPGRDPPDSRTSQGLRKCTRR